MSKLTHSTPDYRGWSIDWDYGQFQATGPDYEPDFNDEDGFHNGPGAQVAYARTLEGVHAEIDAWITEYCEICDGEGNIWKHADPTTGQRCDCYCLDKTGVPA